MATSTNQDGQTTTTYGNPYGTPAPAAPKLFGTQHPGDPVTTPGITPAPNQNQPVIPTSTLTDTTKLNLPTTAPSSGTNAANAIMGSATGINISQNALLNSTDSGVNNATEAYNGQRNDVQNLINQYTQKGADQLQQENAAGIPAMRSNAATLATQYNTQQAAYNAQYNSIFNQPGSTMEQKAQAISTLTQQHGYDLANTAILQSLAETNYTNAQNLVNHQIDIKYAPMKDAIDYGMQFLSQNKDILTNKQTQSFTANLAVQQQMYTQGQYYDHLLSDTKVQMVKDAATLGAPADVQNAIWNSTSIGDAAAAGGQYLENSNYTVVQTGVDQNTGLPIYSKFNPKSGAMEPLNYNGALGTTGNTDSGPTGTVVNGYQFGATTTLGAYASNTTTQVNNIKATVAKLTSSVGPITDASTAQAALGVVAPKSPVTGEMVMSAATQYGVDPATIIGVMQAETQCGTDGSKGAKQCNWGNVGNTDALMASGGSVKMTPQQGVDAIAKNLAIRKVAPGQNDPTQPVKNDSKLTPMQQTQAAVQNAPALLQPAMPQPNDNGVMFIDSSKVPTNLQVMAQSYASRSGIPILSAEQADLVRGAIQAQQAITTIVAPAWNQIAPKSSLDAFGNQLTSKVAGVFNTDTYSANKTFLANKETVAQQVKTLSESAAKAGLISIAETAQPDNSGYFGAQDSKGQNVPYDTLKQGNDKMQRTLDILNVAIAKYVPNAVPVTLPSTAPVPTTMMVSGKSYTKGADGLYYPSS